MKRIVTPEILDTGVGTRADVADALADLRFINRAFGGLRVVRKLMEGALSSDGCAPTTHRAPDARNVRISWLDVAGASGDVPKYVVRYFSSHGVEIRATVLDRVAGHLDRSFASVQADALALPFVDNSFDIVSTSLLIHDLEPAAVRQFANEAIRVARRAVLINELRRSWTHLALVYAGLPLFRSWITRHDAVASVKQAYTEAELREILRGIAQDIEVRRFYLCRIGICIRKQA